MDLEPDDAWRLPPLSLFLLDESLVEQAYVEWLNDPEVNRYLESRFTEQTLAGARLFAATMRAHDDVLFLGIRDERLGRHVGNIKLGPIDRRHGLGEIGLMIGDRAAWGTGVGSAVIAMMADIAGRRLGLRKLTAGCYASNLGSRRAFEKAGFHVEGVRPDHFLLDGEPENLILLARRL